MSDDSNKVSDFKVDDRRTSTKGEGDSGKGDESNGVSGTGEPSEKGSKSGGGTGSRTIPKVDFSTFVFSLFSSALIQLGDMADPVTGEKASDITNRF